jgi:hypothetical protein
MVIDMGLTEDGIRYRVLQILSEGGNPTPALVAARARCSERTVNRVFNLWIANGELVREGTPRGGYSYTFNLGDVRNSA